MRIAATLLVLLCRTVLGVVTSLGLIALGPMAVGMTSTVVMSDSMAPGIRTGDVVVVRPVAADVVRIGQVVLAADPDFPGRLRLHRVAARSGDDLVLKGDANAQEDAARIVPSAVHGVGFLRVPWIGLPVLWLRTGRPLPAVLALAGIVAAAGAVAVLDPPRPGRGPRAIGRLVLRAVRLRRSRTGGAVLVLLAVAAVSWPQLGAATSSWSVFSGTTKPTNSFTSGTWACPALPNPSAGAPNIAYSFMAASGTAETNRGSIGSGYDATLSSGGIRASGTCVGNASPYVQLTGTGSEAVIGKASVAGSSAGSQTFWFRPTAATGVLADIGQTTPSAASTDRQLYFTSSGTLSYALRNASGTVSTCAISGSISLNTWHFAAVTFTNPGASSSKTVVLYLDGASTTCSGITSTNSTVTGYTRIGSDATIASDASTAPYQGGIDEAYAWGAVLSASDVATVRANGH